MRSCVMVLRRRSFFPSQTMRNTDGGTTRKDTSASRHEVQKIQKRQTTRRRMLFTKLLNPAARAPRTSAMSFVSRERSAPVRREWKNESESSWRWP
jgi:hypothetical protein